MEDPLGALSELFDSDSDFNDLENNPPSQPAIKSRKKDDKNESKDRIKEKMRLLQQQMKLLEAELSQSSDDEEILKMKSQTQSLKQTNKTTRDTNVLKTSNIKSLSSLNNKKKPLCAEYKEQQSMMEPLTKKPRVSLTKTIEKKPQVERNVTDVKVPAKQHKPSQKQQQSKQKPSSSTDNSSVPGYKDAYSGLKIISPKISSQLLEKRMEGRKFIKLHCISRRMEGFDVDGDWVTIAVVVKKLESRKASNGKTYNIWRLSSMSCGQENNLISFFLFGDVYQEHWKLSEGSAIALLNASIMPAKDSDSKDDIAITIDNPQKLMDLGCCKDFGLCNGTRKSDGKQCSNFVNRQYGEFCEFHVQRAYKKARSKRMELQSGYGTPSNMNKLKKEISNSGYFHQGQTVTLGKPYNQRKPKPKGSDGKNKVEMTDNWKEIMAIQSSGSRNLTRHLEKSETNSQDHIRQPPSTTSITSQKQKPKEKAKLIPMDFKSILEKKPKLTVSGGDFIEFTDNDEDSIISNALNSKASSNKYQGSSEMASRRKSTSPASEEAKARAVAYIKKHGANKQEDPHQKVRKALEEANVAKQKDKSNKENKSQGLLSDVFGPLDLESEKGKKLLSAESSHAGSVKEARAEKLEEYFNVLEKKERYEEKMSSIMELKVTLVCCKICKYKAEGASKLCKDQNHKVLKIEGRKRFFECKNCKQRTTAYAQIPTNPCRSCNELNYKRVAMFKESNGPKMDSEKLLLRGEEKKFINS